MKQLFIVLSLLIISLLSFSFSQDFSNDQLKFKSEIDSLYNFQVSKLSKEEHTEVLNKLDTFFVKVEKDTGFYLPLLRNELLSNGHLPYFYFDCSHLLMLKSKRKEDLQICHDAFLKCDIKEVGPKEYVQLTTFLASEGVNTTKAALKILEISNFSFFIPQHSFNFSQSYCLLYCIFHLDPQLYTDSLIKIFQTTKDEDIQRAIITVLWFSYSCEGDNFLKSLSKKNTLNKDVYKYAKRILTYDNLDEFYEYAYKQSSAEDILNLKKEALSHFTDEAIWELDFVTKAQRRKGKCN